MIPRRIRSKLFARQTYVTMFLAFLLYCTVRTFTELGAEQTDQLTKEQLLELRSTVKVIVPPEHRIPAIKQSPLYAALTKKILVPDKNELGLGQTDGHQLTKKQLLENRIHAVKQSPLNDKPTKKILLPNKNVSATKIAHNCSSWFEDTFDGNLEVIKNYPKGQADKYMWKVGGNSTRPKQLMTSFPVIVTAANSGFYPVTQGLLKSIHEKLIPKYGEIKIIYYDMGLQPNQLTQLKKYCKCEVRRFPFEEYPDHVKQLKTYTWKPLIVQRVLMEYGWVWWMDSSVRFVTDELDDAINYSRENSFLFFTYGQVFAVAQHTDVQTMEYLGEDRCKFRHFGEIEATFVLFHFDDVTKALVNAWAACALNSQCMSPPGTSGKLGCRISNKQDGRCHRFDQAVLSILLRRLYHDQNDYPLVDIPFHIHDIRRGNSVNYFPNT